MSGILLAECKVSSTITKVSTATAMNCGEGLINVIFGDDTDGGGLVGGGCRSGFLAKWLSILVHSGHEIATNGEGSGNMAPEHYVRLEVDPDADNHWNG